MGEIIFSQLEFIRSQTLKVVSDLSEEQADLIPSGFRNHIRWNLGHIALVQDAFAFQLTGRSSMIPAQHKVFFANGTSPENWTEGAPKLAEIIEILEQQPKQIISQLSGNLDEKVSKPYKTSSGFTLETVEGFLNFSLYHEGMHFSVIKMYKKLIQS
ncbi:DinB family protein [Paenibacillus bouchesdurhonensis]|uniref:DinB family protein n=1 Tax=Paenibacillus bouchesdurhonensis TaxID=1870990 RepID=UPI000DA61A5F|nr:DinB family protein [Paenibacillus bouchesdurhonensis]